MRLIVRGVAVLALGAATAPVSIAPVFADEGTGSGTVTVVDCADPALADPLVAARQAAATAKKAFTDLRGPDAREIKEQRAEARTTAKQALRILKHAHGPEDRAAAKAARADLRAAEKTLRASYKEAVRALKAERRATKAAWDDAKEALHDLREAVEDCETDETDETTDETDESTDEGTEGTEGTEGGSEDGTEDPTV